MSLSVSVQVRGIQELMSLQKKLSAVGAYYSQPVIFLSVTSSKWFRTVKLRLFSQISSQWPNYSTGFCRVGIFLISFSSFSIHKVLISLFLGKNSEKLKYPLQQRWDYGAASCSTREQELLPGPRCVLTNILCCSSPLIECGNAF